MLRDVRDKWCGYGVVDLPRCLGGLVMCRVFGAATGQVVLGDGSMFKITSQSTNTCLLHVSKNLIDRG
jgi:hypothetical protein